jgi:dTDP-4-amino-4,6-dideoxygalactose transaminase
MWLAKKSINEKTVNELLIPNLINNQFTNYGPNVKLLEQFIKEKFKVENNKDVIVVTNGAIALHSLTTAIEYINGKIYWATQDFTFPPSAQGNLKDCKIIDLDENFEFNLSKLDKNINGIIITNIFGNIANINKYEEYCIKNNIKLIYDNAATSYTFYNGKNVINYGIGTTISFHHTKPFGFGEGGAIIVDKKYSDCIRKLNNFGINLDSNNYFNRDGNNYKMSEISAVYILQYLYDNFDNIINHHNKIYNYFINKYKMFNNLNFNIFPSFHNNEIIVPSCICIICKTNTLQTKYIDILNKNNIRARKYYYPLINLSNSINLFNKIICLPLNIDLDEKYIDNLFNLLVK